MELVVWHYNTQAIPWIVPKGELNDVLKLKEVLIWFFEATGLTINYHKSTVVPIHMDPSTAQQCIHALVVD